MSKKSNIKVYVKESAIPNIGKGLFAKINIQRGSIIAEFKGKLKTTKDNLASSRSNIYFHDECVLECPPTDLASYANDAVNFTGNRRKLMESLKSDIPFYKKYTNAKVNASIKINNNLHRAFLMADEDIVIDEEIFCHYGFMYWFQTEITTIGFLQEDEIEERGFPEKVFEYPAFLSYIKEFYLRYSSHTIQPFKKNVYDFIVHLNDGYHFVIPITNFANKISRVNEDEL